MYSRSMGHGMAVCLVGSFPMPRNCSLRDNFAVCTHFQRCVVDVHTSTVVLNMWAAALEIGASVLSEAIANYDWPLLSPLPLPLPPLTITITTTITLALMSCFLIGVCLLIVGIDVLLSVFADCGTNSMPTARFSSCFLCC